MSTLPSVGAATAATATAATTGTTVSVGSTAPGEEPIRLDALQGIIARTTQSPTIVNESSKFVVVTYWWGRGRDNKNTARPCLDFYETLLLEPFKVAEMVMDVPVDKLNRFNWMKWLSQNPRINQFYQKKAEKYIREARKDHLTRDGIKAELDKILQPVYECFKKNMGHLEPLIRIRHEQSELKSRIDLMKAAKKDVSPMLDEVNALVQKYKDATAALKAAIRPFIGRMEALDHGLLYKAPIKYDEMIANWEAKCAENGVNHLAVEYADFTRKGGYQLAINAKPLFIQKALELCAPLAVVYIDGDMTVNRYPKIFDIEDVDFMARGWHIDPRASWKYTTGDITVDPYTFETSGGIMYFSQSPESKRLLEEWVAETAKPYQAGKADDRIISLIFNTKRLLAPMKIIQLPVEYLWLSMDYDYSIEEEDFQRANIFIEHPECLTSEDTAAGGGASSDRTPKHYSNIENVYPRSELLYESAMFPGHPEMAEEFRPWLNYIGNAVYAEKFQADTGLSGESPFYVYKYGDFGKKNAIYQSNIETLASAANVSSNANRRDKRILFDETTFTLPNILKQLNSGLEVIYIPSTANQGFIAALNRLSPRLEFIFVAMNGFVQNTTIFQYEIDLKQPMVIRPTVNTFLMFMLLKDVSEIKGMLRDNYQFLSRIRCHSLARVRGMTGGGEGNNRNSRDTEEATTFLYGAAGGRRLAQKTRRKKHARRTTRRAVRRGKN